MVQKSLRGNRRGEQIVKTVDEFLKREKHRKGDAVCSLEKKKRSA